MAPEQMLHGRDATLVALRDVLADALEGRGGLVVITGEAGIGKTTMASAIAREAEARGATVAWGRAWEFADAPPYFPVRPCLRSLGIEPSHEDAFQLWEQVLAALAHAQSPLVWIIEDLHAADLGTLDLLTFLAQPLRAMRVLVVATARDRDPRVTDRMLQRFARMTRDGLELRLDPLVDRDIAAITQDTLGRAPSPDALRKLVELTGGNPLFVVECARAFRSAGGIEGTLASLPPTVRQILSERVALLPDATRDALASGAVLGREFSAATVARMAGSLPARVIDILLPALRAGIVRETAPGHFMFSHTLVRDAIEDALDCTERAALHGRAESALAHLAESSEVLVERARHALAAESPDRFDDTLALASRAAELLEHDGAFDRAFDLHARIEAARTSGYLPAADATTKLRAARVARAAGRTDASRQLCEAVIAEARATDDPELLARAALLLLVDVRPGVIDRAQVALLEEAHAALGDRAPGLDCRVLARLATALQPAPDPAVPQAMARDALRRAHALGDRAVVVDVLELAGWGMYEAPLPERIAWASELRDGALATADLPKALTAYVWLAFQHVEQGDFAAFDQDVASTLATADELGHPRHRWRALLLASLQAMNVGQIGESDRYVMEATQLAPLTDDPAIAVALPLHRWMRALILRRDDDARGELAAVEAAMQPVLNAPLFVAVFRGLCAARLEDEATAREQLATVVARLPLAALVSVAGGDSRLGYIGEIIAAAGTEHQRRALRDMLARFPSTEINGGPLSFTCDGPIVRVRGLIDAALGETEAAEAHLRDALALVRSRHHVPWVAQIAYELAKVVRRAGRDDEARELADESAQLARELGMPGLQGTPIADAGPLRVERAGADWRLSRGTSAVTVKDSRGMQLLARLIERAGEEIHVLALASDEVTSAPESNAGEVLDDRARKTYRRRLGELADALADAESRGDARQAAAIERERQALIGELARATSLGGKARLSASTTERARINVQKRIKDAVSRISDADAGLGRFLDRAVRTGTFCCFRP